MSDTTISVQKLPNKQWPQWLATLSVCICVLNIGILIAWSSPTLNILLSSNIIDIDDVAWIVSMLQLGSAIGPIPGGLISMKYGPKIAILLAGLLYLIGYTLIVFSSNVLHLKISRMISGIGMGFSYTAIPIYISEIAEKHIRGGMMLMFMVAIGIGSLIVSAIAPYVAVDTMAEILLIFPILHLITFIFAPESPYFYMRNDNDDKAYESIKRLRRQCNDDVIREEIEHIKASGGIAKISLSKSFSEFFTFPNPKAFMIVSIVLLCQQFCGAIPSVFYQTSLYKDANVPFDPNFGIILNSMISIFFSLFVIPLTDRWGRRPLLHLSAMGCIIADIIIGMYYRHNLYENNSDWYVMPIMGFVILQISFYIGLGPILYTIAGEIFSGNVKEIAMCLISILGGVVGFGISSTFPAVSINYGSDFLFFGLATMTFVFWSLIILFVPETKNKHFHDIQNIIKTTTYFAPFSDKNIIR